MFKFDFSIFRSCQDASFRLCVFFFDFYAFRESHLRTVRLHRWQMSCFFACAVIGKRDHGLKHKRDLYSTENDTLQKLSPCLQNLRSSFQEISRITAAQGSSLGSGLISEKATTGEQGLEHAHALRGEHSSRAIRLALVRIAGRSATQKLRFNQPEAVSYLTSSCLTEAIFDRLEY